MATPLVFLYKFDVMKKLFSGQIALKISVNEFAVYIVVYFFWSV